MSSHRQALLHDLPTLVTLLAGETRAHSNHLMTSSCSLLFEDVEKCAPTGVQDGFGKVVVLDHVAYRQVFYHDTMIALRIGLGGLEMMITSLPIDLQMRLGSIMGRLAPPMTAFLAAAQLTLLPSQSFLRSAIEARILNAVTITIGEKGFEPNVKTNISMLTHRGKMVRSGFGFTHDQGIPMSISPQDQMDCLGRALHGAMQLDLEEVSQLLGDNEVFLVLMEIAIFPILAQLNRVPAVRFLEAGETDPRDVLLLSCKKALERLTQTISQHLNGGGRNMCALSLESRFQVILAWEGAFSLILRLDGLKHRVRDEARLFQALHEQMGLVFIHEQAILKGSHADMLVQPMRHVNRRGPPAGGRQFTHMAQASGPLAASW
jgi:hypothetical protein